jgi:C4-dicarboxylate-specific signal transduction histidine kinase
VIDNFLEKIPSTNLYNEQKIYNKLKEEISSLQYTINEINTEYTNKNIDKAIYLINNRIYPTIDSTNIYLSQLTNYILKKAISEKDDTDMLFQATFWIIFFVIIWVVVVSVFFAHYILENIKNINISLEKKVNIKTKELQMLNSSLEDRIKEEIKISRLKDEMIFQQAKLASMGEMLANIAHQWRQPLNALTLLIQSFYFKSINKKLTEEFVQTQSDEGLKIAKSMSDTINEFRNYFKPDVQKSDFDINEAIDNALFLIDGEMKKSKINIIFEQDDEIHLEGFVNSFTQVVINIVTNAKDALNESEVDDKTILIETKESNRYVIIEISDNGGGIDEEIIDRIFEPYFTTKHQTVGTGIGLYMSKNIINEHFNGNLEVKNCIIHLLDNSYKGVKFTIMLDKN